MRSVLWQLWRHESGVTSIEYAFIAIFVGLAIVTAVRAIGTSVAGVFTAIAAGF